MNFWLKENDSNKFKLPVTPSSYDISVSQNNSIVNIISLGDINLLGNAGLRAVTLSSFFPAQDYQFAKDYDDPMNYVDTIETWRKDNVVIRFIIKDTINMECTVESFTWGEHDGTRDIYYSLALKEYKQVTTKKRTSKTVKATTHKVKKSDTLNKVSKKYYGSANTTLKNGIVKANPKLITKKTSLPTGKTIKIPKATVTTWQS